MYFYEYDFNKTIPVPPPFKRYMTPIFMGDQDDIPDTPYSLHMTEWEPGCEIDMHTHPGQETMFCWSGHGKCIVNGEEHDFVPGSMIVAPEGVEHKIWNTGDEMLRVFCVFSPPVTGESLRKRAIEAVEANRRAEESKAVEEGKKQE